VQSGYLATDACPDWREEYFLAGTEPTAYCPEHGAVPDQPLLPQPSQPHPEE